MFHIKLIKKKRKDRTLSYEIYIPIFSLFMNTGSTVIA